MADNQLLQRRFDRERQARKQAEQLLEKKSLELFSTNERLKGAAVELEQRGEELQKALNKEKEINGLQRQFVSMVSHEFRTPLAIIDGNAQRIMRRIERIQPERVVEGLGKTRLAVQRLVGLMESVLAAARLEEGKIAFKPGACCLKTMLTEITSNYSEINPTYQIIADIDELPDESIADADLLRQVFSNLISNAIKYSPEATTVTVKGYGTEIGGATISVTDQGVGIPEAELPRLCERFFRASTSTGIAGSGIGLHLVQSIIDMHGGSVEIESKVNQGTTFTIHLPPGDAHTAYQQF